MRSLQRSLRNFSGEVGHPVKRRDDPPSRRSHALLLPHFLGEPDEAISLVPTSLSSHPLDIQFYFHFATIAISIEQRDLLAAERAIDNFLKRFQRRKSYAQRKSAQQLALLYRKFIRLSQAEPRSKTSSSLKKLKDALSAFKATYRDYHSTLPVAWLERKLAED